MKKKTVKKLVLAKETVRSLEDLTKARGFSGGLSCADTSCFPHRCPDMPSGEPPCPY